MLCDLALVCEYVHTCMCVCVCHCSLLTTADTRHLHSCLFSLLPTHQINFTSVIDHAPAFSPSPLDLPHRFYLNTTGYAIPIQPISDFVFDALASWPHL